MKKTFLLGLIGTALLIPSQQVYSAKVEFVKEEKSHKDYRQRLYANTPEPAYSQDDIEAEIVFGREVASKILAKYPPLKNNQLNTYVNKVGQVLAENGQRPELNYHFVVLDDEMINAFAAPGGYIFITKGAIDQIKDEAELAGILGHEIGHIEERHYVKQVGLRSNKGDPEQGFTAILSGGGLSSAKAFNEAIDQTMEILFEKGLQSKKDEYEADATSVWLLANTGYDPQALKRFFQRIEPIQSAQTEILEETHPPLKDRISKLDSMIKKNDLEGLKQATLEERFNENK